MKMFEENKNHDGKEVELVDEPEKIDIDLQAETDMDSDQAPDNFELLRAHSNIINRYTHEKKTIVFFMYTCRRLRNLAKERQVFKQASNNLMYGAILLLKKGMIMNDAAVSSLKFGSNIYGLEGFEDFCKTEDCERLREELESKDTHLYNKLFSHLKDKVKEEVEAADPRRDKLLSLISDQTCNIMMIDEELKKECATMIPHFLKSINNLSLSIRFDLMLTLAHTFVSAFQDEYLKYMKNGVPFDWHEFDKSWQGAPGTEKINLILTQAKTKFGV